MIHICFKLLIINLIWITSSFASVVATIFDYNEFGRFVEKEVVLEDLISNHKLDGHYFKIVLEKNDDAVLIEDKEHGLRAAHIYYHLTQARNYFKSIPNVNNEFLNKKIVIRINIKNAYDSFGHFAHDDFSKEYNTAVTIPESNEHRIPTVEPWDREIWFRPAKELLIAGQLGTLGMILNQREVKTKIQVVVLENSLIQYINQQVYSQIFNSLSSNFNFLTLGIGIAAVEFLPKILVRVGSRMKSKFYLDTGMVPEIIYHEYSHFALSDKVELTSTPVVEGLANYFAGKISKKAHWGNGPYEYTTDRGRNAFSHELYDFRVESKLFSTGDFVFKLLWGLQNIFNENDVDQLIYLAREDLTGKSNIKFDLVNSLFERLSFINKDDINHRLRLHIYMQGLGL